MYINKKKLFKKLTLSLLGFVLIFNCIATVTYASEERIILYVSPTGNDSHDGSISSPLASVIGARDRIRALRENGANPAKGFVVYLREGKYFTSEGIVFNAEDSGTLGAPVTYRSYPNEKAIITGARSIDKSYIKKADQDDIVKRIVDKTVHDKIYSVKLNDIGVVNPGVQSWYGAYSYTQAYLDKGYAIKTSIPAIEFAVDDTLLTVARYPNDGYMNVSSVLDGGWNISNENDKEVGAPFTVKVDDERIKNWGEDAAKTALLFGFWRFNWADQTVPLASVDPQRGTITSKYGSIYSVNEKAPFYVYNLPEEIDAPGEYFIDRENNVLYFYPPNGNATEINLSVVETEDVLLSMSNASYIQVKDITFSGSRNKAISITGGEGNLIEGCEVFNTSMLAVDIASPKSGISNSYIHDVEGGVKLRGGDLPTLTHGDIYALNCEIRDYSRLSKTYQSAVTLSGVGNIVAFNEIHSAPHLAISYSGNDHKIYYNNIYDVVRETDDSAAIYGGQDWVGRGHEIYYNYIHDISYLDNTMDFTGAGAIYMDGGQCELYIKGNVIENVEGIAFWVNSGQDNQITNNIVINDDIKVGDGWRNRWGLWLTDVMKTADFSKSHCPQYRQAKSYVTNDVWRARYGNTLLDMIENQTNAEVRMPRNNVYQDNILVNTQLVQYRQTGTEIEDTIDVSQNYVSENTPFDAKYQVPNDSEVLDVIPDFENIPFEKMGRTSDRAYQEANDATVLVVGSPYALVNGVKELISEDGLQTVSIRNSRSYVSLDFLADSLDLNLARNGEEITLSSDGVTLVLTPESLIAELNGEEYVLSDAIIKDETETLIAPLGDIAKIFGKEVFWHNRGFISISDVEIFDGDTDFELVVYLHDKLNVY